MQVTSTLAQMNKPEILGLQHATDVVKRGIEMFDQSGGQTRFVKTGIQPFDEAMGGIMPSTLTFIGARTGGGKTSLMLQMAIAAAKAGKRVMFISAEDREDVLGSKVQARHTGIAPIELMRNVGLLKELNLDEKMYNELNKLDLYFAIPEGVNVNNLKEMLVLAYKNKFDIVFFDFLTMVTAPDSTNARGFYNGLINMFRDFSLKTTIPIVASSQLRRKSDGVSEYLEPSLSELKETGAIEERSQIVMLVWKELSGERYMRIAKNKVAGHFLPKMALKFSVDSEEIEAEVVHE